MVRQILVEMWSAGLRRVAYVQWDLRYAEPAAPAKSIGQVGQSLAISGKVSMAPSLAGKGSATDTLFVFARETNGPPMPVAIMRATKKDLPFTFRLDDSTSMMPSRKLSDVAWW